MPDPIESYKPYTLTQTLQGHKSSISSVKFSSDGRLLGSSSADKTIKTYSLSPSNPPTSPITPLHDFHGHEQGVSDLAFSSDSRFIVSASDDKTLRLWDVTTGSHHQNPSRAHQLCRAFGIFPTGQSSERQYTGHANTKYCISPDLFHKPNGMYIVGGS
ncbi:COMPASS-like H3K4 histone methylase component WDR5A [Populus alba x Populus x berolinensis]|nr:COMPASS-like H3K4 histone methylase component WDR5A [Populus alba x Populus x berolinensis]